MDQSDFIVRLADGSDGAFAGAIAAMMEESAKARGTGIAKRDPAYLVQKMEEGKAIIAFHKDGRWAGFCYIEVWSDERYVANSGLIVHFDFRQSGLARAIKGAIFELSRTRYPNAKIFGLTTGAAVMRINSELGYRPVTYSELTDDDQFWSGCRSCVNFEILQSKNRKNCLCTAMLFDPAEEERRKARQTGGQTQTEQVPVATPADRAEPEPRRYRSFRPAKLAAAVFGRLHSLLF